MRVVLQVGNLVVVDVEVDGRVGALLSSAAPLLADLARPDPRDPPPAAPGRVAEHVLTSAVLRSAAPVVLAVEPALAAPPCRCDPMHASRPMKPEFALDPTRRCWMCLGVRTD